MFITALKYFGRLLTVLHNTMESMNIRHLRCSQFHLNTFLLPHIYFYCSLYLCQCRKKYIKVFFWLSIVDDPSLHMFIHSIQKKDVTISRRKMVFIAPSIERKNQTDNKYFLSVSVFQWFILTPYKRTYTELGVTFLHKNVINTQDVHFIVLQNVACVAGN